MVPEGFPGVWPPHLFADWGEVLADLLRHERVSAEPKRAEVIGLELKERKGTKSRTLSNRRANMVISVLRLILDPVVRRGWLTENPAREIGLLKEERANIDPLSFTEV